MRRRSGGHFDPAVAAAFVDGADELLPALAAGSVWDEVLDAEPEPRRLVDAAQLPELLAAFADFADLQSPYTLGQSPGVAELAATGAQVAGLGGYHRGATAGALSREARILAAADACHALSEPRPYRLSVLGAGSPWPGFRETHQALLTWLPRRESAVIPRATHLLQIADPDGIADALAAFLARHALQRASAATS